METYSILFGIILLSILSFNFCHCQTYPYITEPKLKSVVPINSTALTVTWEFANESIDRSDLIKISVVFYEYYYDYNRTYASSNYTFTSTNKTVTNLTKNFDLVNAYYYVCFSSNSSVTNSSYYLSIQNNCILTRTCLRSNLICPPPSTVIILPTNISSASFIISFLWPNDLIPCSPTRFSTQLISNNQIGSSLGSIRNSSHTNFPFLFTNLQLLTSYTVNTSFTYRLMNNEITNTTFVTVKTTSSSILSVNDDGFVLMFYLMMILILKC